MTWTARQSTPCGKHRTQHDADARHTHLEVRLVVDGHVHGDDAAIHLATDDDAGVADVAAATATASSRRNTRQHPTTTRAETRAGEMLTTRRCDGRAQPRARPSSR
jgi:hypothetical protein